MLSDISAQQHAATAINNRLSVKWSVHTASEFHRDTGVLAVPTVSAADWQKQSVS